MLRAALERHQGRFEDQVVRVRAEFSPGLPDISVDSEQLDIVLDNLLENALEAMPQGGILTVSTEPVEREGRKWVDFHIADSGPDMLEAVLKVLFEPFTTGKDLGTGLGLTICKKLIEDHGGDIQVRSRPGQGVHIRISLPVNPGHTP